MSGLTRVAGRVSVLVMMLGAATSRTVAQSQTASDTGVSAKMERAMTLRRLNRKAEALALMEQAVIAAPDRADVAHFRDLLEHEVHGAEAVLGGDYTGWNDGREPWREAQLSIRKNTERGPMITRFSDVARFGLRDDKVELEAYPAFPGGYGALGVSYATSGALYARTTLSAEVFKTIPTDLEASLGFRRLNFPSPVNMYTGSLGRYFGDFLCGARVFQVTGGASGRALSLSARRYLDLGGQFIGAFLSSGSIREDIQTAADLNALSSRSIGAEGQFVVRSRWLLNGRAAIGRDELRGGGSALFSSLTLGFGRRF